ncbi:TetR/AcrR family transcriptional regulator [Plantibacter sp. M259]|uniref:TetR/AcrR family transcriptional regulator n=1 Tax=Plantibacter sp. M259 TaxID=2583822 RepID=UPI0011101025|nr:TetR/AcrR family transcriptional regulator [Plantibacter sp. M259]
MTTDTLSPRIERILSAARDMALRDGIRGITIAEIARIAGVGKGTLYLYWTTKEDLFVDLFAHDFLEALSEVDAAIREDPTLVAPHRLLPLVGDTFEQHPLAAAVRSAEQGLLGTIAAHPALERIARLIGPVAMLQRIFPILRRYRIIRSDMPLDTQVHATAGLLHGLHDIGRREPVADLLPDSDPQAVLAQACAVLLESTDTFDPGPAARDISTELIDARRAAIAGLRDHGLGRMLSS